MKQPLISVIIPCYNCESFIVRCVKSIVKNTYKNLEIICINDGSKDGTLDLLYSLKYKYSQLKVLSKDNGGQGSARNIGIDNSTGEYIAFVDSDDTVTNGYFETLVNNIGDSDIVVCNYNYINSNSIVPNKESIVGTIDANSFWNYNFVDPIWAVVPWNKLYKRELFNNVRFKEHVYYEDEFFMTDIIKEVTNINVINKHLYNYYKNPNGTMNTNVVYRKLYRVEARNNRSSYFIEKNMTKPFNLTIRENLFLLLRLRDLAKKHNLYEKYNEQIIYNNQEIIKIINLSIDKGMLLDKDCRRYVKKPGLFSFIYFFRKIARVILKRSYENA